jgi:photosystem II stability/assembly factor-like uncharacterized protein
MKNTYYGSQICLYAHSASGIIINRILYPVFLCLIIPLQLTLGQTSWSLSTVDNSNKVTVRNGSNIITSIPVMLPNDQMMVIKSPLNTEQNNLLLTDWTQLQTVGGVVKAVSFANSTVGYMAAELGVVYKTTDGGLNWTTVMNLGFPYYWYGIHTFTPQKVLIAGFNNTTGDGIMRWTYDGGVTWSADIIVAPAPFNWLMGLDFADSLHGLAVGNILSAGSVFITDNGGTDTTDWTKVVADPTQGWFAGNFTMRTDGKYYITGISFCNSTDYGMSWARRNSIDNVFDGGVTFPDDLHGWTGGGSISPTVEGWVHNTTDGGNTWSGRILSTPYPVRVVYFFDSQIGIAQGGEVNSGVGGIWESTDGGSTWNEAVVTGLEMGSIDWKRVSPDSIDIWSVGYTSSGGFHSVVYKKRIGYSIVPVELKSFSADVRDGSVVLNWQTATEINNKGFGIERLNNTVTGNQNWEQIGFVAGFGTTTEPRSYSFTDEKVTSGSYSYRLKQLDFNGSASYSGEIEVSVTAPEEFTLKQNYPNPFNPSTRIEYSIPSDGFVSLKVYNALGQQVASLMNGMVRAGIHQVTFKASNLPSGVYYYRMETNDKVMTKQMVLLK